MIENEKAEGVRLDPSNVFEMAMVLGKALKKDPHLVRMEQAKQAYEADAELSRMLTEYDVQRKAIEQVAGDADYDPELVGQIQHRIDELYEDISANETFKELNEAQAAVNNLMNAVNSTIMFAITGEMPSGCTHDCSSCGGCH